MKVYKFGGASIKDYKSIIRLSKIIRKQNHDKMILIVSAMGKTTNSMEKIVLSVLLVVVKSKLEHANVTTARTLLPIMFFNVLLMVSANFPPSMSFERVC